MIDRERAAETLQPEPPPLHLHGQEKMFERPRAIGGFSQARLDRMHTDRVEASPAGMVPLDRLAKIAPACRISRARVVDAGRIVTAGGIASGMEMGFHLLQRAGYSEAFCAEVARVMEYQKAYDLYRSDIELNG